MNSKEAYILYLKDFPNVFVAYHENEFFIQLHDALKGFGLDKNSEDVKEDTVSITRFDISTISTNRKQADFIDYKSFERLFQISKSVRALDFFNEVSKHKYDKEKNFDGLTTNDFHHPEIAQKFIEERNELLTKVMSLETKERKLEPYIKIVKNIYGTKIAPVNFINISSALKYSKPIPSSIIAEHLRQAGIFDEHNQPKKTFVDKNYFRVITLSSSKLDKYINQTSVLVLQSGIKLIEEIIDNRLGGKKL